MRARPAAPEVVVVERRQVVVNETVAMHHLDRRGDAQRAGPLHPEQIGAGEDQMRPHALARAGHGIAHGFDDAGLRPGGAGKRQLQDPVHLGGRLSEAAFEVEHGAGAFPGLVAIHRLGADLAPGTEADALDLHARLRKLGLAVPLQVGAALIIRDGLLEADLALLELPHEIFELLQRLLEAEGFDFGGNLGFGQVNASGTGARV